MIANLSARAHDYRRRDGARASGGPCEELLAEYGLTAGDIALAARRAIART